MRQPDEALYTISKQPTPDEPIRCTIRFNELVIVTSKCFNASVEGDKSEFGRGRREVEWVGAGGTLSPGERLSVNRTNNTVSLCFGFVLVFWGNTREIKC